MRSVVMDRWGLDSAFQRLGGDSYQSGNDFHLDDNFYIYKEAYSKKCTDLCWENFLTAVVLWDEIWSFNKGPFNWDYLLGRKASAVSQYLNEIMHQVDPFMIDQNLLSDYHSLTNHTTGPSYFTRMEIDAINGLYVDPSLCARTYSYQAISQCLGLPYLAHPFRENSIICENIQENFNRMDILKRVDKELERYYRHINRELERNLYQFRYPVLVDMIKRRASTPEEELFEALEIREDPDVLDFRDAMNSIEQAVQNGCLPKITSELELVSGLAEEITKKHENKGATLGEFSISIPFAVSASFPFPLWRKTKYKPQTTFIRRLINYGVNERTLSS